MENEIEKNNKDSDVDKHFGKAAYYVVMFLIEHYRIVREELNIDYDSFIILQVVNSHWLYNRTKESSMSWSDSWKALESNEAKKTLRKKKLSILAIADILKLPQETTRRKVQKLIDMSILKRDSSSGIIYNERFISFHKEYSAKFAKMCANFVLDLDNIDKEFFKNILKLS